MALFNKINRRIKSMQEGGQPFSGGVVMPNVDDGSIGGFNRPELKGLRKQARRGTLTNRERRRLNYLTNEVKGRRKRGLLSGLGGAAAALGTAALIKSGGAKGLMDSIKGKVSDLGAGVANKRMAKMLEEEQRERFGIGEKKDDPSINIDDIEIDEGPELDEGEDIIEGEKSGEELGAEAAAMRQLMEDRDLEESDRELDEIQAKEAGLTGDIDEETVGKQSFGKGQVYSTEDMLEALQNAKTPEEEQAIADKMGATGSTPNPAAQQLLALQKGRGSSGGPLKGGVPSGQGKLLRMPTEDMLAQLQQGVDPSVLGAVRGGGGQDLASKIDPEGLVEGPEGGSREEGALAMLKQINKRRADLDLPPVSRLTKELLNNPTGRTERVSPREAGPIESSVERPFGGTLPQLRAQQLLRGSKMNVGGMVKRLMNRYN